MKVLKMYADKPDIWEEITLEEAIEYTEGRGYWKKDSVKDMLIDGLTVRTPWAFYKANKRESER
jgi:hypothetical protein